VPFSSIDSVNISNVSNSGKLSNDLYKQLYRHCALCTVNCALYIVHCILCTEHCALNAALCTVHGILCIVHCALYTALCIVHCTLCTEIQLPNCLYCICPVTAVFLFVCVYFVSESFRFQICALGPTTLYQVLWTASVFLDTCLESNYHKSVHGHFPPSTFKLISLVKFSLCFATSAAIADR
jgi:hypothetical protein